jgi:hypothetical protein
MTVEFSPPSDELSQGDLFADVPSVYVEDLRYLVKTDANAYSLQSASQPRKDDRTYPANAVEARTFGIVITHDCEIDKNLARALVYVALVRKLDDVAEEFRDGFRSNTRHRAFYLPSNEYLNGEHYADLRRMTPIRADALLTLSKVATMNQDGRRMLREHLFRFFSRQFLPSGWVDWPTDADEE